tara:strand:+ start:920 stop:1123 length:204 start_codon:yes stop_codon:yes gene_type:complete
MDLKLNYHSKGGFEDQLMSTWQVTDDIKVFGDMLENGSLTPEALKGMAELYDHKFNELYQYFEASIK